LIEQEQEDGSVGRKLKVFFQVLWETGWINPELLRSKCNKAVNKGRDFDENGQLKLEIE
jgi:hypothetical protein